MRSGNLIDVGRAWQRRDCFMLSLRCHCKHAMPMEFMKVKITYFILVDQDPATLIEFNMTQCGLHGPRLSLKGAVYCIRFDC